MDWWKRYLTKYGRCEFETQLSQTFLTAYFRRSPLLKQVKNAVGGFGKKVVSALM